MDNNDSSFVQLDQKFKDSNKFAIFSPFAFYIRTPHLRFLSNKCSICCFWNIFSCFVCLFSFVSIYRLSFFVGKFFWIRHFLYYITFLRGVKKGPSFVIAWYFCLYSMALKYIVKVLFISSSSPHNNNWPMPKHSRTTTIHPRIEWNLFFYVYVELP